MCPPSEGDGSTEQAGGPSIINASCRHVMSVFTSCHQEGPWAEGGFCWQPPCGHHPLRSWGVIIRPFFGQCHWSPAHVPCVNEVRWGWGSLEKTFRGPGRLSSEESGGCPGALTAEPPSPSARPPAAAQECHSCRAETGCQHAGMRSQNTQVTMATGICASGSISAT